MGENIFTA